MAYAGYERLSNEIILSAVKDYRIALRRRDDSRVTADRTRNSLEAFFRSDWFKVLTDIDGEMLIRKLQEEVQ